MDTLVNRSPTLRSQSFNAAKRCNFRQHFEEIVESIGRINPNAKNGIALSRNPIPT